MFRKIYGPKYENGEWKSRTNRELEEMRKGENIVKWIKGQRISWLGHLERMVEDRMPKKIFTQELEGTRRRGRPRKRWKEEVERETCISYGRVQLKCDGTRWRAGEEVKGKMVNGVGSQYSSHYLGTRCIQHFYRWCAHLGCAVVDWTDGSRRFKWTHPFRRKTKSGLWACAITFQLASIPPDIGTA